MKPLSLCSSLLAFAVSVSVASARGVDPTQISLPKGPGSIEGLGRNFVPSLASGTASYGVDIAVPPGAGGLTPHLGLEYDSGGGVSEIGMGWRLGGLPSLRRRTENGLPRFNATDALELVGLGVPCDLLEMSPGIFRPAEESGAFVRVQRGASEGTWEARDKSGTTYRFGGTGFTEAEGTHAATYLLRETVDLHNHKIAYAWDTSGGRGRLLSATWNDYGDEIRNLVALSYEDRPDPHVLFSAGIRQELTKRLKTINVTHGGSLVRRYDLTYAPGVHSHLATVDLVGNDGTSRLPTLTLSYTEPSYATDGQITTMANPPGRSPADPNVEIADLDGDGLPDLLVTEAGQFRSYINHDGKSWKAPADWQPSASPSVALATTGVQLTDVDGDGALDLVVKNGLDAFRYFPGKDATSFGSAVPIATVPNFTFEDPDVRLADMDGDRRTDAVITTEAGLAIAYNLGGADWTQPALVGVVDARQPLRFSDGHTRLCDVNGDRVQDICYLRPGGLVYWLGRGRGQFEPAATATGVPEWDPSSPWELHDLDGDGWVDLVHVGVDNVDYALAKGAGQFDMIRHIAATPEEGPDTVIRFADMNGSGTTDIVWIDVSGNPGSAWRYLELFPKGRAGLLSRIDNGLGKLTSITYAPAGLDAGLARDSGTAWTTRINVAMPVVKRVELDDSLGDPTLATEYVYSNGTYDPSERTFAGFGGGTERQLGDEFTPTFLNDTSFDMGLVHRMLRGAVLSSKSYDEHGYIFTQSTALYTPRSLDTALDGRSIDYAFKSSDAVDSIEGPEVSKARTTLTEWEQDKFGNVTAERHWGEFVRGDKLAGDDEAITIRTFANDEDDWILGRVATEELQDVKGNRIALRRIYYDGAPFVGLALGQLTRGDATRQEEWVGPEPDHFELDIATSYDPEGRPLETKDAIGGGRLFGWDDGDHTTLKSETVKLEAGNLTETADFDPAFGTVRDVVGYDGKGTSFAYDAFGRVAAIVRPGDSAESPTIRYSYVEAAPLSRVVTERRVWAGREDFERTEFLIDGLGRKRAALTKDENGRWVLAGTALLDTRGLSRRSLRPRFVAAQEHDHPSLGADGPGLDSWRDASGRTVRTRTQLGIETRATFEPFVTKRWDGAQNDPNSAYEHTPTVETSDGLGRLVSNTHTLDGKILTASFGYDAAGRLVAKTDPEGNGSSYQYDGRGRRTIVTDPDVGTHHFGYDSVGNLTEHRKPDGTILRFGYDLGGREITEDWDGDGKPDVSHTWDKSDRFPTSALYRGKLVSVSDPSGATENEYDERGRVTVSHHTIDGATYDIASAYDDQDREYLHVYPDGSSIRIHRNPRGQLAGYGKAVQIAYDGDGVETQRVFNTGVAETTGYDDDRRRREIIATGPDGATLQHLRWNYDGANNILGISDLRTGIDPIHDRSETYGYDNLYRLRRVDGTWGNTRWNYSPSGNLVTRTSSDTAQQAGTMTYGEHAGPHALTGFHGRTIAYDAVGRMLDDGERSYTWNAIDELTRVSTRDGRTVESKFDAESTRRLRVEHDASGSVKKTAFLDAWAEVRDGKLVRFIVHGGRRIARLADGNGQSAAAAAGPTAGDEPPGSGRKHFLALNACAYFLTVALILALGNRYKRLLLRGMRYGVPVCAAFLFFACQKDDVPPGSSPILDGTVQTLGNDDELLFGDAIGSLTEETTAGGKPKASFASYPFGVARYDTSGESRKYANSPRDGVGLDQMGARAYAPDLGVWTSADPLAVSSPARGIGTPFADSNPYAYAGLTPLGSLDADGHWVQLALAVGGLIGGAGIEAYRQYKEKGCIESWGRVAAWGTAGAVAGLTLFALPIAASLDVATGGVIMGMVGNSIANGGKSVGTPISLAQDAVGALAAEGVAKVGFAAARKAFPVVQRAVGKLRGIHSEAELQRHIEHLHQLEKARAARDALAGEVGKVSKGRPAAVTGGYNTETGEIAARGCGGGRCAEDHVVDALGGDSSKVRLTEAVRPRNQPPPFTEVPVCANCEANYGREAFPEGTTFKSDGK